MSDFIPVCEPFLNGNEEKYLNDAIKTGWISSSGKYIKAFEEEFARYCGAKYAVAVCNGTVALHLGLVTLGINAEDEVIIPDFTMIASAFSVCYTGAKPVFVDVDKDNWNIDINQIEKKITPKTKAIMPVSIFGHPCEMDKINGLAKKYDLKIIEDAAESHGAEFRGVKVGNLADLTCFSFFANKNLTTGEGGMVVTNNEDLFNKLRYYKNLCFPLNAARTYLHNDIGFNYRMSNLHAAIGLAQVEKADEYRNMRIRNAEIYKENLEGIPGIETQKTLDYVLNVHWMNGIVVDKNLYGRTRDQLIEYLKDHKIDTRLLFNGMHRQVALKNFGCDCNDEYPVSDYLADNGFYLPSASNLSQEKIIFICNKIKEFQK